MEYIPQETASEHASSDKIRERSVHSLIHHQNGVRHEILGLPSSATDQAHQKQHAPNWNPNFKALSNNIIT